MKKINKRPDSLIIIEKLSYDIQSHRDRIRELLSSEQEGFCAYTETRITATNRMDIEHFNPNYKGTIDDNYYNWYAVNHAFNSTKSTKWFGDDILHPSDSDIETRIFYDEETGTYRREEEDIHANNLIDLLDINNHALCQERRKLIGAIKSLQKIASYSILEAINWFISHHKLEFRRAVETVFDIQL